MINTEKLDELIGLMMTSPVYSKEDLSRLWKKDEDRQKAIIERMFETGETHGVASGAPSFLNQPEEAFRKHLRKIDNDLSEQVEITKNAFSHYLITGDPPAPYYPRRIAIILSKNKMKEKEKEFLSAWCRHFARISRKAGVTYGDLVERAIKMGVPLPAAIEK